MENILSMADMSMCGMGNRFVIVTQLYKVGPHANTKNKKLNWLSCVHEYGVRSDNEV